MDTTSNKKYLNIQCELIYFEKSKRYALKLNGDATEEFLERITKDMLLHNHNDFSEQTVAFYKPYVKRMIEKKINKRRGMEKAKFLESYNDPDFKVDPEVWGDMWILELMYKDIQKLDFEYKDDLILSELAIDTGCQHALARNYILTLKELIVYMQRYKLEDIDLMGKTKISNLLYELELRGITKEYIEDLEITYSKDLDIKRLGISSIYTESLRDAGINSIHQLLDIIENQEIFYIVKNYYSKEYERTTVLRHIELALICRGLNNCELVDGKYIPIKTDTL